MLDWITGTAMAIAFGFGSALVPVVNAEAYAVLLGATTSPVLLLVVVTVALALGQTVGKVVLFEASRRGSSAWAGRRVKKETEKAARKPHRLMVTAKEWLASPRKGPLLVLSAASVGLPPLAAVSIAAGAAGQGRTIFAAVCFSGRAIRFGAIVIPAAGLFA